MEALDVVKDIGPGFGSGSILTRPGAQHYFGMETDYAMEMSEQIDVKKRTVAVW